jgi:hypothetical protein
MEIPYFFPLCGWLKNGEHLRMLFGSMRKSNEISDDADCSTNSFYYKINPARKRAEF